MVFFNYATMQMAAKIVYYGPGLCGKTTNLQQIYSKTSPQSRGEMVSLETETDRTLFFDLLPIDVGVIGGFKTRLQLYTVPGQVFYNTTRKLVLKGVDGIVFVADSQKAMLDANADSLKNLRENLREIGLELDDLPVVIQLNKRDLPNIATPDEMLDVLDPERRFEPVEAVAASGQGVFETLKVISKLTLRTLRRRMTGDEPVRPTAPPRPVATFRVQAHDTPPRSTMAGTTPVPAIGAVAPASPATLSPVASVAEAIIEEVQELESADEVYADKTLAETAHVGAGSIAEAPVAEPPAPAPSSSSGSSAPAPASSSGLLGSSGSSAENRGTEELRGTRGTISEEPAAAMAEPEINFSQTEKPQKVQPEVKTVKVRSSVDVMAELESLRKRATNTSTPKVAKKEVALPEINIPRPKRDLTRSIHLNVPTDLLPKVKAVRVTLSFEDGSEGVLETRDQRVELADTTDVQSLSVNLKIDSV